MAKWQNGWKVIRNDRYSCTAVHREFPIKYLKNRIAEQPTHCGPLAVFETRQAARRFKRDYEHSFCEKSIYWMIVKCKYIKSRAGALWETACHRQCRVPARTALANQVKCLE